MFFIVLLIPVIWRKINQLERRRMIFLTLSIFLLLLQNYYDTSPHYLIFIVPYIVLLVVIVIRNISYVWVRLSFYWVVLLLAVLFLIKATKDYQIMRRNTENHRELTRKQQLDVAGFLQKVIPPESKTVVARQWNYLVTPHLYGLVNIVPTDYRNTRFGFEDDSLILCLMSFLRNSSRHTNLIHIEIYIFSYALNWCFVSQYSCKILNIRSDR